MLKKILPILVLLALVSSIVACSDNGTQSNQLIKATWIEPQVVGDTISVPVSEVESDTITHFKFRAQDEDMTFMAYDLSGEIYVRANICPPCHSIGFSLQQSTLVCDTCGTVFAAKTGAGIKGACVAYPKAEVAYNLDNGNIVMRSIELVAAYQNTVTLTQPSEATTPSCHNSTDKATVPGCCGSTDKPRAPSCCGGI
jgi:nitrite reductase/ring-hydroxylating ferredoxin subunit